ncbi:MAG TPA: hypothetical protein GXZ89_05970 [Fastidiosipila sp.]|nr:hypothetical protein [Fastidiosipila sp.]
MSEYSSKVFVRVVSKEHIRFFIPDTYKHFTEYAVHFQALMTKNDINLNSRREQKIDLDELTKVLKLYSFLLEDRLFISLFVQT